MSDANRMKTFNGYEVCDAAAREQINGVNATSDNGMNYYATVKGIDSLTPGVSFVMIPQKEATAIDPTLNVNGLGNIQIRQRATNNAMTTMTDFVSSGMKVGGPVRVTYNEISSIKAWVIETPIADLSSGVYGTLPVSSGGTGATTIKGALNNLGITWSTSAAPSKGTPNSIYIQIN